jgi:hypothetical protein
LSFDFSVSSDAAGFPASDLPVRDNRLVVMRHWVENGGREGLFRRRAIFLCQVYSASG